MDGEEGGYKKIHLFLSVFPSPPPFPSLPFNQHIPPSHLIVSAHAHQQRLPQQLGEPVSRIESHSACLWMAFHH